MRRNIYLILVGLLFFGGIDSVAQKSKQKNRPTCEGNSYSSEIVSRKTVSSTCVEYVVEVSYDGRRSFGLSHFTLAIPCGDVSNISNSENWKQVFGKDPTTGIYGLKIDDIEGFGEKGADSFTIKFTWCSDNTCEKKLGVVAYKAGQCVDYETLKYNPDDQDEDCDDDPSEGEDTDCKDKDHHHGDQDCEDDPNDGGDGSDGGGDDNPTDTCSTLVAQLQKVNASCSGINSGELRVVIQDGTEPFTYAWSTGATTSTIQNLIPGNYAVTVTDAKGNTLTLSETIVAPEAIVISESIVHPSCSGFTNGSIDVTITGGSGVYTVVWSNGSTAQDLSNLAGGTYTITVTDASQCTAQKTISLINSTSLTAGVTFIHPTCTLINGTIDITPTGGVAPYTYLWSTGATTQDLQNNGPGSYTVKITDATGCTVEKVYALRIVSPLVLTYLVTPTNCIDNGTGAINLSVSGGTAPYTFLWQDGPTTEDRIGLKAGLYRITVTDAGGCTAATNISVFKRTFEVTSQIVEPLCAGDRGSITVSPVDGVPPYSYSWGSGSTDNTITDLVGGVYTVIITDGSGCSRTMVYVLTEPTAISASITVSNSECAKEDAYAIDLTLSGGKSPYYYEWSNGATTQDLAGMTSGTYSVTITDANGCTTSQEVVVNPTAATWSCLINQPGTSAVCNSVGNVLATSLVGATTYQWSVSSSDNSWVITAGSNAESIVYSAGNPETNATFTLTLTKDGCTQTCSYTTATNGCIEKDNTGGGDPATGDPCAAAGTSAPLPESKEATEETPVTIEDEKEASELTVSTYPNPFIDRINFEWTAPSDDYVNVEIYDAMGRKISVVFDGNVREGQSYNVDWIPLSQPEKMCLYFYKYRSTKNVKQGRLLRRL